MMDFTEALRLVDIGFEKWVKKPHNAAWIRRFDGTPIRNDVAVCIAEAIAANTRSAPTDLVEALRPLAALADIIDKDSPDNAGLWSGGTHSRRATVTAGDARRAHVLLAKYGEPS